MKQLKLKDNEVPKYTSELTYLIGEKETEAYLYMTNLRIAVEYVGKRLFFNVVKRKIYTLEKLKIVNDVLAIDREDNRVTMYFEGDEKCVLIFGKDKEAKTFISALLKIIHDGDNAFFRFLGNVGKLLDRTATNLGFDLRDIITSGLKIAAISGGKKIGGAILNKAKGVFLKKK